MIWRIQARRALFKAGIVSSGLSLADLVWSYVKPVHATDYIEQFHEAMPNVKFGALTSLAAVPLLLFGWSWQRAAALGAVVLFAWWFCLAGSLV